MMRPLERIRIARYEDDGYENSSGSRRGGQRKNRFDHQSWDDMPQILTPSLRSPLHPKLSYDRTRRMPSTSSLTTPLSQVDLSLSSTPPRDLHVHHSRPLANEMGQSVVSSTLPIRPPSPACWSLGGASSTTKVVRMEEGLALPRPLPPK